MRRHASLIFAISSLWLLMTAAPVQAGEWKPYAEVILSPGSERIDALLDVFLPLQQSEHGMFFTNLRGTVGNHNELGGSVGVGYRRLVRDGRWILGGYGFYDRRRSRYFNTLQQLVLGGEALSRDWDVRANLYLPRTTRHLLRTRTRFVESAIAQGNSVLTPRQRIERTYERAMPGLEVEIGRNFPWLSSTRAFVSAFHFRSGDARNATGGRVRFEKHVTPWLTVGARAQFDNLRKAQGFLELRLRAAPWGRSGKASEFAMAPRMTDYVYRGELDIFATDQAVKVDVQPRTTVQNSIGGDLEVFYVKNDSGAGGDGTFEAPFDTLAEAEAAAGTNDLIYVYEGDGTDTGQDSGITLAAGQQLIGSGVALKAGGFTVLPAATAPLLTNAGGIIVELANNVEVAGLQLTGAVGGLRGNGVGGLTIRSNSFSTNTTGVSLTNGSGSDLIRANTFTNNGTAITTVQNAASDWIVSINSNTISSTGVGNGVFTQPTAGTLDLLLSNNTLDNLAVGLITLGGLTNQIDLVLSSNTISNAGVGVSFNGTNSWVVNSIFDGNTFSGNTQGFVAAFSLNLDACVALRNNTSDTVFGFTHNGALALDYEDVNNNAALNFAGIGATNQVAEGTCDP